MKKEYCYDTRLVWGKKEDVVKEKIAFKFPMSNIVMTVSGKFYKYQFSTNGLIFIQQGSCYIEQI